MIDSMFQAGTDQALNDLVQRPKAPPPKPAAPFSFVGFGASPFRGAAAGVQESVAFGSEVLGAFGQVMGAYPEAAGPVILSPDQRKQADAQRQKVLTEGINFSNETGDIYRNAAKNIMPDPETSHASEQVVAGLFRFGTKAVGYTLSGGVIPGAAMLGGDEALTEAERLKQQGVDFQTRAQAGAVAGAVAGVSTIIPMTGLSAASRFVKGVAVGEATMIGQAVAEKEILKNAGYDKIADTFDPFDPVALAVGLVPGALGAKFGRPSAKQLAALKTEADVKAAVKLTSEEQARSDAYERSAANIRELEGAIKTEKNAANRLLLVDELEKQRAAQRENYVKDSMRAEPDLEPAARVQQVADALDRSRLTPDNDLRGMADHQQAIETAHDQMARGEQVNVDGVVLPEIPRTILSVDPVTKPGPSGVAEPIRATLQTEGGTQFSVEREFRGKYKFSTVDGESIGSVIYTDLPGDKGGFRVTGVEVRPEFQRKGIASAVYDFLEHAVTKQPMEATGSQSPAGAAFRADRATRQSAPQRTAAAITDLRAAREQLRAPPTAESPELQAGQKTARQAGDVSRGAEAPPTAGPMPTEGKGTPETQASAAVSRASAEVAALNPDMLVQLEGMDQPMRVADLMARVTEEAKQEAQTAKLVQVAAECALTA